MYYSRVWWWLSFQGPYIFPLIEKEGGGWRKEEGVVAAMIGPYGMLRFRSGPCSQVHYLPGGEKHMFTVYNRRDWKLNFKASYYPQEVVHFVWAHKGNCTVSPGLGLTKLNLPQQKMYAGATCSFSKHLFLLPQHGPSIYYILQIAAELATIECQIAGGGPAPVKDWHLIQTG